MAQKPTAKHTLVADPQLTQLLKATSPGCAPCRNTSTTRPRPFCKRSSPAITVRLADRAGVHLSACNQQLEKELQQFKTA